MAIEKKQMDYYWLIQSTGDDIGRASSQVKGMKDEYDLYATNSIWKIPYFDTPNFEPNFDAFVLNNSAKITDIIVPTGLVPGTGFLINEKVKFLIQEFKLPTHLYFNTKIIHRHKLFENYSWIQFTSEQSDLINFQNSIFDLKKSFGWQNWITLEENITFENKDDLSLYYDSQSTMNRIIPQRLKFVSLTDFDIMGFGYFSNKFLVSQKVNDAFDLNNVNGVELLRL